MFDCGDSTLLVACDEGVEVNYVHVYTAGRTAYFMSGVNLASTSDGSGKLIHWRAMQYLKSRGYEWYDLGGVRSQSESDGIYNFKRRFGGQFVSLGAEWRHATTITNCAIGTVGALRRISTQWDRWMFSGDARPG
jgi:hypothetical protein